MNGSIDIKAPCLNWFRRDYVADFALPSHNTVYSDHAALVNDVRF